MAKLELKNVTKSYGTHVVLKDISLDLEENAVTCLLGKSGSGKTTVFNLISGVEQPDSGEIMLENKEITGKPGYASYMLQKDLLLPFKKIEDNVILPLILSGTAKSDAVRQAAPLFEEFGLGGTQQKYPAQLSGGMRQRAAFLRTYLMGKEIVLLDEPFSALDAITRENMQQWFTEMLKKMKLSVLFITHDINEAILLSDTICVIGGSPARVVKTLEIPKQLRIKGFELTEEFLEYKKAILTVL